jgi:hypothetical protein
LQLIKAMQAGGIGLQVGERIGGGGLLGIALAAALARTQGIVPESGLCGEDAGVIRAIASDDHVHRSRPEMLLQ